MYELCRHIMPTGKRCGSPAVSGQTFCHNHREQRQRLAKINRYEWEKPPLPFVPSEDRDAIQLNYNILVRALSCKQLTVQEANSFNRFFRSCEMNLSHKFREQMAAARAEPKKLEQERVAEEPDALPGPSAELIRTVILTPDGDEIAPPLEVLEEGESHGEQCPCRKCARRFRAVPPEQHHADCRCNDCAAARPTTGAAPLNPAPGSSGEPEPASPVSGHAFSHAETGSKNSAASAPADAAPSKPGSSGEQAPMRFTDEDLEKLRPRFDEIDRRYINSPDYLDHINTAIAQAWEEKRAGAL